MSSQPVPPGRNPTELLTLQLRALQLIYQVQSKQTELLENILTQQERMLTTHQQHTSSEVKVVDFNMPFFALVGMLVKVSLASIPAALILAVILATILFVLSALLGALGILVGGLGGG